MNDENTFTLRCERIVADKPNLNGNIYSRELLKQIVERAQERISRRVLLGRVGTSADPIRISDASHIVTGLEVTADGHLSAQIEVLNTEQGRALNRMLAGKGVKEVEIIPFGSGSTTAIDAATRKVGLDYRLQAIDVVPRRDLAAKLPERIMKVRVPIVVDEHGNCYSTGWLTAEVTEGHSEDYEVMLEQAYECHVSSFPESRTRMTRWATIEVPVPDSETELDASQAKIES